MSLADQLTFWLTVLFVLLCAWSTWLAGELIRERAAHRETKLHFRRVAVAEWAKRMPRTGKIAVDPLCPKDVVYCINPDTYRGPSDPEAA